MKDQEKSTRGKTKTSTMVSKETPYPETDDPLREIEQQTRTFLNSTSDMVFLKDESFHHIIVNSALCKFYGKAESEIIGKTDFDLMDEKAAVECRKTDEQALLSNDFLISEEVIGGRYYETRKFPVSIADGKKGIGAYIRDITERRRVEESLRASDAKLRAILDATPFPIAIVDVRDNVIEYWSQSALALFGHTAPTTPEWYHLAYPDPEYRREVIDRWKHFLETARLSGQPVNTGEYRVSCHDGSVRVCELYATFLPDNLIVTFRDVTDLRHSEDLLMLKNLIFDTSINANSIADREGVITEANDTFLRLWDYPSKDEVIGNPISYFLNDLDEAVSIVTALNGNGEWKGNFTAKKKDGSTFIAYAMATVIRDGNGKVTGYQSSVSDVTAHREAEFQREAALIEIGKLNENLEQRIEERTAELTKNIDLLEETNRAFVGRELRIIELKEQIAELEKKKT